MTSPKSPLTLRGGSTLRWYLGNLVSLGYFFVLLGAIGLVRIGSGESVAFPAILVATLLWTVALVWPSRLEVHEDGVTVRSFLRRRFVPYAQLKRARGVQQLLHKGESGPWSLLEGFELELEDGSKIALPRGTKRVELTGGTSGDVDVYCPLDREVMLLAREVNTRIEDARFARPPRSALARQLARGERPLEEWISDLAALAKPKGGGYRDGPDEMEPLFSILEDERAPRDVRAAAAAVLRERVDEQGRARMRVALEPGASPKLRVFVETALDESAEREAVVEALERASVRDVD